MPAADSVCGRWSVLGDAVLAREDAEILSSVPGTVDTILSFPATQQTLISKMFDVLKCLDLEGHAEKAKVK